jgi:integrase
MVYRRQDAKGWWFHCYDPITGKQRQVKCKAEGKRAAELESHQFKAELKKKSAPPSEDDFLTFVFHDYWPGQKNHLTPKGLDREAGILRKHLGPFFHGPMHKIDRRRIIAYIGKRQGDKVSSETIRKELTTLKHILRIAVKLRRLARNPFDDLERKDWPPPGVERTRHLIGDEWIRLLGALPIEKRPAVILLVNSGMRRGELCGLEWQDIDFEAKRAWAASTKAGIRTGQGRWITLTPAIVEILKMMPKKEGEPRVLWQFSANALSKTFGRTVRRARLVNLRLHDLRHSFATSVRQAGHGIDVIAQLLGHSDLRQTRRYAHIGSEEMQVAVDSLGDRFTNGTEKIN